MSMPSVKDQVTMFKSEMKNSLSEIISAYKKGRWSKVNALTAMFPNTPNPADGYISPTIKVPAKLEKLIDDISYRTQSTEFAKRNNNKLSKKLVPNLVKEAKAEKLM